MSATILEAIERYYKLTIKDKDIDDRFYISGNVVVDKKSKRTYNVFRFKDKDMVYVHNTQYFIRQIR
jgi:hypothetical protein